MTDQERIDGLLASRMWRQPLIGFGTRAEIDLAIERGNPDHQPHKPCERAWACEVCKREAETVEARRQSTRQPYRRGKHAWYFWELTATGMEEFGPYRSELIAMQMQVETVRAYKLSILAKGATKIVALPVSTKIGSK